MYYFVNSNQKLSKDQIGGKGFYLHQMYQDGLPIPEAVFLSTELWKKYYTNKEQTISYLKTTVIPDLVNYFKNTNHGKMPLLSVRSSGAVSMPGMMDTILNVGVNHTFLKDFIGKSSQKVSNKKIKNLSDLKIQDRGEEFAVDIYTRFLTMYGQTVLSLPKEAFKSVKSCTTIEEVQSVFEKIYNDFHQKLPSQSLEEQLLACILAVFDSWNNDRAKLYRKINSIDEDAGTAVVIQRMVFGNKNDLSATGVLFSRHPSTGESVLTGEYLVNAQGEDVVSGSTTPENLENMANKFPRVYIELEHIAQKLEHKYKQVQDIEFTIENNCLFVLQARTAKCSPFAKLKMLIDLYKTNDISPQDVLGNFSLKEYLELNIKKVDDLNAPKEDGKGLPASMGALTGRVVFEASHKYKEPTIFVAHETTPDDLEAIQFATGILTASGGATSHAAVVARGMGKVCVVGCSDLKISEKNHQKSAKINGKNVQDGDWLTIDANTGKVWVEKNIPIIDASNSKIFWALEDLALDLYPTWTRVTSNVDELNKDKKAYFLTYNFDDKDLDFIRDEFRDICLYLNGILDLTGQIDYLDEKYAHQFLFSHVIGEETFNKKKELLLEVSLQFTKEELADIQVYLGPYQTKYAAEFKMAGFHVLDKKMYLLIFNKKEN